MHSAEARVVTEEPAARWRQEESDKHWRGSIARGVSHDLSVSAHRKSQENYSNEW